MPEQKATDAVLLGTTPVLSKQLSRLSRLPSFDTVADVVAEEDSVKEKAKRDEELRRERLKEYGGPVSICKLLSIASPWERFVLFVGVLFSFLQGAGQPTICLLVGGLFEALSAGVPPMSASDLADQNVTVPIGFDTQDLPPDFMETVEKLVATLAIVGVCMGVSNTITGVTFPWFGEHMIARMRPLYLSGLLYRDIGWLDAHDGATLPTALSEETQAIVKGFGTSFSISFTATAQVLFGWAAAFWLTWQVGAITTVCFPLIFIGCFFLGKALTNINMETQGSYLQAGALVEEVLHSVRTVVSYGGERRELARFEQLVEAARKGGVKGRTKLGAASGYIWLVYFSTMGLAFWFGMKLRYDGHDIPLANLIGALLCVLTGGMSLSNIAPGITELRFAKRQAARFFYCLGNESHIQRKVDNRKEVPVIQSLKLDDVYFEYPARPGLHVLDGLSLEIKNGQKVAIIGESGAGKSTVMALLERFYDPTCGQVLVNGEDLRNFSVKSYRRQIGYVGQEPVLFATTIQANIMQGCGDADVEDLKRVSKTSQLEFVKELPEAFQTYVGTNGSQFSGGQKQRIALARALVKKPSVLFLDEATSALDSSSEKMIQETIDKIARRSDLGMTMVCIAHRLSTIQNSDVIFVLKDGQVAEEGRHMELLEKEGGLYRAQWAAQKLAESEEELRKMVEEEFAERPSQCKDPTSPTSRHSRRCSVASTLSGGSKLFSTVDDGMETDRTEEAREAMIKKTYKVPTLRLLGFCRPEWWYFVPGFAGALLNGGTFPVVGIYLFTDAILAFVSADREVMRAEMERAALLLAAVGITKCVASILQYYCFGVVGEAITKRCRVSLLTMIFSQEIGYHDDPAHTPGTLTRSLEIFAYRIANLCILFGSQADAACTLVVGLVLAFYYEWRMTLVMLFCIPACAFGQFFLTMATQAHTRKDTIAVKYSAQLINDAILNVRTVHACGSEADLLSLYQEVLDQTLKGVVRRNVLLGFGYGFSASCIFFTSAVGLWCMGKFIEQGLSTFDNANRAFLGLIYAIFGIAISLSLTGDVGKGKVAAHDLFQMLDRKSTINGLKPEGDTPSEGMEEGIIEFRDVSFFYPFRPDVKVLKGLSFAVQAGQSVGIVGPSGGGKSTIMAMIQRFYDPQRGSVLIGKGQVPLESLNIRWWRSRVAFVGQEPVLFDGTVFENVMYGLQDDDFITEERLEECKVMSHMGFIDAGKADGWQTQVGLRGSRLSGGQKQRVAICRALVRDPPVLLLDEATSALDSRSERIVQKALEAARKNRTSFVIAHRISTVQDCDVIMVVSEGAIVEKGTHAQLLQSNGVYSKLYHGVCNPRGKAQAGRPPTEVTLREGGTAGEEDILSV